ncbi:Calcitonin gene-related peptide type 1 receptor [Acipenser ruthenus]|uniref:Calcitonin gene-related peptide type 1 receptor n=1 Tax=Acipenser ruthenus TaxID=7906 RepID=A0A662YJ82_ACIRT|nr:Calcitonin gene-related peptide type 1 receptor [Acipenser ruthenus]
MERGQLLWILLLPLVTEQVPAGALVSLEPLSAVSATPQSVVPMGVSRAQILSAQFECYLKILRDPPYRGDGPYCNRTWDGWMCWEDTPPGNKAVQFCPQYFQDFDPLVSSLFEQMAYSKYYLAITGHCLSLNLFLSFILDSIVTIICLSAVANNHEHETHNTAGCKVLQFLYLYTMGCNYFWMLCEGIYLHTLIIVAVFVEEQQMCWYYILGWGFPLIPAVIHAVARLLFFNDNVLITAPPFLVAVNLFFLLNIVRVLITKLKVTHQAESSTYMKAVRATLILVPLLGIQFVLLPWKPEWRLAEEIYEYIMHIFMHYQGLLVATIFCFCNGEVQAALKREWLHYKDQCSGRLMSNDLHSSYHTNSSVVELSRSHGTKHSTNGKNCPAGESVALKPDGTLT